VAGPSGAAVPDDGRLPLVGDADGGDVLRRALGLRQRAAHHGAGVRPDLLGIVLDPAAARQQLVVFELFDRDYSRIVVEQDAACRRRSLVYRRDH